jgi:hypothetical protein
MAQISYRANLSAATYPMTISDGGRTVIMPGPDNNYDRRVDPTGEQKDAGIPQALYMENVLPTANGYQSVGSLNTGTLPPRYSGVGTPDVFAVKQFFFPAATAGLPPTRLTVSFRTATGYRDHISSQLNTVPLTWTEGTGDEPFDSIGLGSSTVGLTTAYVRGVNYLFDGVLMYTVNKPTISDIVEITDISGTLTGLTLLNVVAICSCANYLIALLDDNTIAWSSTTTPTDFTASLVSGAGSQIPADLKSSANFLSEAPNGFFIFSVTGVVYAAYTGNSRYPFKFTAIENSGGYTSGAQVAGDRTKSLQYAIDDAGNLRAISPNGAQVIAQDVSTFIERQTYYDQFDYSTNLFSLVAFTRPRTIYFLLDRYILVPLGNVLIVYDTALQRFGKLKGQGIPVAREDSIAVQLHLIPGQSQGIETTAYNLGIYDTTYTYQGVLVLGKFQYVRSRKIQLHEIEIEGPQDSSIVASPNFSCVLLPSQNGRTFDTPVVPYQVSLTGGLAVYSVHATAQNHSIILKGAFNVNTVQLKFSPRGDR